MSFCQGNVEGCTADEDLCPICGDVMACSEHGHADAGAQNDCPYEMRSQEKPSLVAGVFMDRSLNDFTRACEVYIEAEQRKIDCDTWLVALLCDAVRLTREMSRMAR